MRTITRTSSCIVDLSEDWREHHANRERVYGELGACRGGELIERIRGAERAERDRLVSILIGLVRGGHEPAERLLLVLMLPRVVALTRTCRCLRSLPPRDAQAIALGAMWEALHGLPANGRGLLARMGLDALRIVTRSHGLLLEHREQAMDAEALQFLDQAASATEEPARELASIFDWALANGTLTRKEARILATVDLGGADDRERLAREFGVAAGSLLRRSHRLRARLREAVRTEIERNGRW